MEEYKKVNTVVLPKKNFLCIVSWVPIPEELACDRCASSKIDKEDCVLDYECRGPMRKDNISVVFRLIRAGRR